MPVPTSHPKISDEVTFARYPFLPQAAGWIRKMAIDNEIDLDELLDGVWMEKARQRARIRLVDSINSKEGVEVIGGDIYTEEGRIIEAFSFYYARLVVCASEDERLIARWAQAEAARAEQLLIKDKASLDIIARTYISQIKSQDQHGLNNPLMVNDGGGIREMRQSSSGPLWKIGLSDFIEICPNITGPRWRLPNNDISNGWITLFEEAQYGSSAKLARLLRERIKRGVEAEALGKMQDVTTDLAIRLAEPVGMLRNLMSSKTSEAIALVGAEESEWPPCMRKLVSDLSSGVNVNHFGRLFLASISATIGLPTESTVNFFRGAPDFSESTTNYQVSHVYEHAYTPAGCGKLKVNHNCPVLPGDDRLCDQPWLDHPLKYIRATQRRNAKNKVVVIASGIPQKNLEDDKPLPNEDSKGDEKAD
jgi:DNA primase large subunit